jgi:hypothetical protein
VGDCKVYVVFVTCQLSFASCRFLESYRKPVNKEPLENTGFSRGSNFFNCRKFIPLVKFREQEKPKNKGFLAPNVPYVFYTQGSPQTPKTSLQS